MRAFSRCLFDEVVSGTTPVVSMPEHDELMASVERLSLHAVAQTIAVGATPWLNVQLDHTADGLTYAAVTPGAPEINRAVLAAGRTDAMGAMSTTSVSLGRVRLSVSLNTGDVARVKVFVTGRTNAAAIAHADVRAARAPESRPPLGADQTAKAGYGCGGDCKAGDGGRSIPPPPRGLLDHRPGLSRVPGIPRHGVARPLPDVDPSAGRVLGPRTATQTNGERRASAANSERSRHHRADRSPGAHTTMTTEPVSTATLARLAGSPMKLMSGTLVDWSSYWNTKPFVTGPIKEKDLKELFDDLYYLVWTATGGCGGCNDVADCNVGTCYDSCAQTYCDKMNQDPPDYTFNPIECANQCVQDWQDEVWNCNWWGKYCLFPCDRDYLSGPPINPPCGGYVEC